MRQTFDPPDSYTEKVPPFSSFTFLSMRESDQDIPISEKKKFTFLIFDFEFCLPFDISFSASMLANIPGSVNSIDYIPFHFTCNKAPGGDRSYQRKFFGALWYKVPRSWEDIHVAVPLAQA